MTVSPASTKQTLRLGIVGCGKVVEKYHLPALLQDTGWRVAAAFDPSPERRTWIEKASPGTAAFEGYDEFLERGGVDAVLVAAPPHLHCELSVQALEHRVPVLVEKPMALSYAEARLMTAAAERSGQAMLIGFNRRFRATYMQLKNRLVGVSHGEIRAIHSSFIFDVRAWQTPGSHIGNDAQGGGVLDDVASHQADLFSWLLGTRADQVSSVRTVGHDPEIESVEYQLEHTSGLGVECLTGHGPMYRETIEIEFANRKLLAHPGGLFETGNRSVILEGRYPKLQSAVDQARRKVTGRPSMTVESFARQLEAFAVAVRTGEVPPQAAGVDNGLYSVRFVEACKKSLNEGGSPQTIPVDGEKSA